MFWNNLVTMAQLTDTVAIKIRFHFPLFGNNIDDKIPHGFNWNYKCYLSEITIPVHDRTDMTSSFYDHYICHEYIFCIKVVSVT